MKASSLRTLRDIRDALNDVLGEETSTTKSTTKIDGRTKAGRAAKAPKTADSSPKIDGRTKEGRALKAKLDGRTKEGRAAKAAAVAKIDGRTKEGRALKAALKGGAGAKKIDGRSKEARAAKAAAAGKAAASGKPAKAAKATQAGKIDGRTKEGRALKAAAAGKGSAPTTSAKIDGRTKEGRALKAAAAGNGKPGPKKGKKAEAKAPPAPKKSATNATEGRRAVARGDRPTMKEAIATVMGKSAMGSADIVSGLEKKGWLPNAQDPQQYVSYLLSSNKDVFERLERGLYKVREGAVFSRRQVKLRENGESEGKGKKAAAATSSSATEAALTELGIEKGNVASNPFG